MKILRLFVTNHLEEPINWVIVEENEESKNGTSMWEELSIFENVQLEVYLDSNCCSILTTNVEGISTKRLSEELILGMLEESIVDEIEEIKPIILRTEEDLAYVAIFNKIFYQNLIAKLIKLNYTVRFLQSFAFSTKIHENEWALFVNKDQQFIRTSKFEYFLIDNEKPIPLIVKNMLNDNKPNLIRVYGDEPELTHEINREFGVECVMESRLEFGTQVWNFYNAKSTQFNIKLDDGTRSYAVKLLKTVKSFAIIMLIIWIIDVLIFSYHIKSAESKLKKTMASSLQITQFTPQALQDVTDKLEDIKHGKGFYAPSDAIPLFSNFLNVMSDTGTDSIVQISYNNKTLEVFLNSNFNSSQFVSHKNILASQYIKATIVDYKTYQKQKKEQTNSNNPDASETQQELDASWVVTLQPTVSLDLKDGE
ncbi:MAG: hypothetical protein K2P99_06320 [Burkholderiales bacterium]|nr:hypothetical protein [Burkholderiales bacterium]